MSDLRKLLGAQLVSFLGTAMAPIALAMAVLDARLSGTALGLVIAARTVAQLLFYLVGGVLADRFSRRNLMVGADSLAGIAQAVTAGLIAAHAAHLAPLMMLQAAGGAAAAIHYPASTAALPILAGPDPRRRRKAAAGLRAAVNAGTIGGTAAVGVILAVAGAQVALAADAATFGISALCIGAIRTPLRAAGSRHMASGLGSLREGWREVRSRAWLLLILAQAAVVSTCTLGAFLVLGPLRLHGVHGGKELWAASLSIQAVGALGGSLAAAHVDLRRPLLGAAAILPLVLAPQFVLGISTASAPFLAASFVAGVVKGMFIVLWLVTLQGHIPDQVMSRVAAFEAVVSNGMQPVGTAIAGPIAAATGVPAALTASGFIGLLACLVAPLSRQVRTLGPRGTEGGGAEPASNRTLKPAAISADDH